jgi:calcium-dependent protein kinase
MKEVIGTALYFAPEVLQRDYTSQCDLWSLGVVGFILLSGEMPFKGRYSVHNISTATYDMKPEKWRGVSARAQDFIVSLLEVDPAKRLSAQKALEHPWMASRQSLVLEERDATSAMLHSLQEFTHCGWFRRCCMKMLALSLPNEERIRMMRRFMSLDKKQRGTVCLQDFTNVTNDARRRDSNTDYAFRMLKALSGCGDEEIHYLDFLAAAIDQEITLTDDLLASAFNRFDVDCSGVVTVANLQHIIGHYPEGKDFEAAFKANHCGERAMRFADFSAYLIGLPPRLEQDSSTTLTPNCTSSCEQSTEEEDDCPTLQLLPSKTNSHGVVTIGGGSSTTLCCFPFLPLMMPSVF